MTDPLSLCAWLAILVAEQMVPAGTATDTQALSQLTQNAQGAQTSQPSVIDGLDLIPVERDLVERTNAERARFGLAALEIDPELMQSARAHCTWMTLHHSLQHTRQPVAENIAMGQQSGEEAMRSWMSSSGHRANILNPHHRRIGVAAYRTAHGTVFWCQQFRP
ncbi:MAG: CAP domain-containing protein [Thermoguttaceae bacterium]|jgi:uncharacterized protein YkwD|nr:CAP domain-containing protein [Thermoguttaceae bacterium]